MILSIVSVISSASMSHTSRSDQKCHAPSLCSEQRWVFSSDCLNLSWHIFLECTVSRGYRKWQDGSTVFATAGDSGNRSGPHRTRASRRGDPTVVALLPDRAVTYVSDRTSGEDLGPARVGGRGIVAGDGIGWGGQTRGSAPTGKGRGFLLTPNQGFRTIFSEYMVPLNEQCGRVAGPADGSERWRCAGTESGDRYNPLRGIPRLGSGRAAQSPLSSGRAAQSPSSLRNSNFELRASCFGFPAQNWAGLSSFMQSKANFRGAEFVVNGFSSSG